MSASDPIVFPEVALSRDGQRAILVLSIAKGRRGVTGPPATAAEPVLRLAPRRPNAEIQLIFGDQMPMHWDNPRQQFRWPESFTDSFPELAVMAIGEYLDDATTPAQPDSDRYAAVIPVDDHIWSVFRRPPEEDDAPLLRYVGSKLYWAHKLGADSAALGRHDALRFGLRAEDLDHLTLEGTGVLWERLSNGRYRALPRLLSDFRSG